MGDHDANGQKIRQSKGNIQHIRAVPQCPRGEHRAEKGADAKDNLNGFCRGAALAAKAHALLGAPLAAYER